MKSRESKKLSDLSSLEKPMVVDILTPIIIKYTKVQSLIESEIYHTGQVSLRQYYWHKSGDTVLVQDEDVPALLEKRLGKKTCCGDGTNKIFQIAS